MACSNCPEQGSSSSGLSALLSSNCTDCNCPDGNPVDASCVFYTGPNLSCSTVLTNDNLETILSKLDGLLCSSAANYAPYNKYCVDDISPITTQQEFVEGISQQFCQLKSDFTTFSTVTEPGHISTINAAITAINFPLTAGMDSCTFLGISPSNSLSSILNTYGSKICDLYSGTMDMSSVNWTQCYATSIPSTVPDAFTVVLSQICQLKNDVAAVSGSSSLTFNNTGSCLPTPGTADSLVDTVNKIKTRLCQSPSFDINALTWTCIAKPSSNTTDLQSAFQSVLSAIDDLKENLPNFTADFSVSLLNPSDPCQGKRVALSSSPYVDKFFTVSNIDPTPGTFSDKVIQGSGILLDYSTTPGKVILSATASGGTGDNKVKVTGTDTADFLVNKITTQVGSNGASITPSISGDGEKLVLTPNINISTLIDAIIDLAEEDDTVRARLCALFSTCPSPCDAPTDLTVTYLP